jgi:hypothetical protein
MNKSIPQIVSTDPSNQIGKMVEEYTNHKWYQGFYSGLQVGMISVTIYYLLLQRYYK